VIIVRLVEVRGSTPKIDTGRLVVFKEMLISPSLPLKILEIAIQLLLPLIRLTRKQAVTAPFRLGRQAVGGPDIHVEPFWDGRIGQPSLNHHLLDRDIPLQPKERRGMGMQNPVALPPCPLLLDVVVYLFDWTSVSRLTAYAVHVVPPLFVEPALRPGGAGMADEALFEFGTEPASVYRMSGSVVV
jgi:hypothetical protein